MRIFYNVYLFHFAEEYILWEKDLTDTSYTALYLTNMKANYILNIAT